MGDLQGLPGPVQRGRQKQATGTSLNVLAVEPHLGLPEISHDFQVCPCTYKKNSASQILNELSSIFCRQQLRALSHESSVFSDKAYSHIEVPVANFKIGADS